MRDSCEYLPLCRTCHERRARMRRVFCWWPTKVFALHWPVYQRGCRWLTFALRDIDGKHYVEEFA